MTDDAPARYALEAKKMMTGTPLESTPWGNDEADPKVGWSHLYDWRGDARYAGMVPKVVNARFVLFLCFLFPSPPPRVGPAILRTPRPALSLARVRACTPNRK